MGFLGVVLAFVSMAHAEVTVNGLLRERGTKKPIANASIFVIPYKKKVYTDQDGRFSAKLDEGNLIWIVNRAGYKKLELTDTIEKSDKPIEKLLYIEKVSYLGFETRVYGRGQKRDASTRSLKTKDFATLPGAQGDPIKAIENLPGVARQNAFDSRVIIQGSAPQDTRYTIDGHEVPNIFHFGGLTSVFFPDAVERVDYLNAGYGVEYGRAMGGLITLWTKTPRRDRLHGFVFVDTFKAGALFEVPTGKKSSFSIGFRRSYIGEVLKQVLDDDAGFNLTVAPRFTDISSVFATEVTPRDEFRLVTVASRDELKFILDEPVRQDPSIRGGFENKTEFFRLIPQWTHKHSAKTWSRWSAGLGRNWTRFVIGDSFFVLKQWNATIRGELEKEIMPGWKSYLGFDNRYTYSDIILNVPFSNFDGGVVNPFSSGEDRRLNIKAKRNYAAIYLRNELKPTGTKWTFFPQGRIDYFAKQRTVFPAPRIAADYALTDSLDMRSAGGLYFQPPQPQEEADTFGNPGLDAPRAWHASLGAKKDFRKGGSNGFEVDGGLFYRFFDKLVVQSTDLVERNGVQTVEAYANEGRGRAYGIETLVRLTSHPLSGWVAYTLSRSERWSENSGILPFQYDQTHNINVVAAFDLPRNWKISTRVRYVTGNPFTPVSGGIFDSDNDVFIPTRGPVFSERLSPFFQADIRVDKKWIFDNWILSLYLDIQNATNRQNIENVQYSYDYSQRTDIVGLPVLPSFGLRGEF